MCVQKTRMGTLLDIAFYSPADQTAKSPAFVQGEVSHSCRFNLDRGKCCALYPFAPQQAGLIRKPWYWGKALREIFNFLHWHRVPAIWLESKAWRVSVTHIGHCHQPPQNIHPLAFMASRFFIDNRAMFLWLNHERSSFYVWDRSLMFFFSIAMCR